MRPQWQHDCDRCQFLGSSPAGTFEGYGPLDWYKCEGGTFVARFGDDGPDYMSGRIGECVSLTRIDRAVLMLGFELTETERDRLLRLLVAEEWRRQPLATWQEYGALMDAPKLGPMRWCEAWEPMEV